MIVCLLCKEICVTMRNITISIAYVADQRRRLPNPDNCHWRKREVSIISPSHPLYLSVIFNLHYLHYNNLKHVCFLNWLITAYCSKTKGCEIKLYWLKIVFNPKLAVIQWKRSTDYYQWINTCYWFF